jgi:hypothetical protein
MTQLAEKPRLTKKPPWRWLWLAIPLVLLILAFNPPDELRFASIKGGERIGNSNFVFETTSDSFVQVDLVNSKTKQRLPFLYAEVGYRYGYSLQQFGQQTVLVGSQETSGSGNYTMHNLVVIDGETANQAGEFTTCGRVRRSNMGLSFIAPHDFHCGLLSRITDWLDGEIVEQWRKGE